MVFEDDYPLLEIKHIERLKTMINLYNWKVNENRQEMFLLTLFSVLINEISNKMFDKICEIFLKIVMMKFYCISVRRRRMMIYSFA
jgi:hypothetical protein